jgi:hypothetical protein
VHDLHFGAEPLGRVEGRPGAGKFTAFHLGVSRRNPDQLESRIQRDRAVAPMH